MQGDEMHDSHFDIMLICQQVDIENLVEYVTNEAGESNLNDYEELVKQLEMLFETYLISSMLPAISRMSIRWRAAEQAYLAITKLK